jgi:NAD(P)-dependent dehydrogenase (short-subunit alcohol dehydrogenase family)
MSSPSRVVVITGATGGLGRAFARAFAGLGDRLILTDLDAEACASLAAECGNGSVGQPCDLADPEGINAFWAWMDATVGAPDVLLNNAGVGPSMQPTVDTDPEDFARVIDVNLVAAARMLEQAVARMAPGSAIVTTASLAGLVPNPRRNAYGAAKAALVALTQRAARVCAPKGIAVSVIAPGYVFTDMVATLSRTSRIDLGAVRRRVPLGRLARPDEMASVVRFLASPEGGGCAGQTLPVDGGWSAFNMGGDACPEALPAPPAESAALSCPKGTMLLLAETGPWSDSVAQALGEATRVVPGDTAKETEARMIPYETATCVVVVGAEGGDQSDLYRRDFTALREAIRRVRPTSGTVVYVAAPESADLSLGLREGGMAMLLRGMAAEFGPEQIRINGVFPRKWTSTTPWAVAQLVRFLAGHDASYMTGAMLGVSSDPRFQGDNFFG